MPRGLGRATMFDYQATSALAPDAAHRAWSQDFLPWLGRNGYRIAEETADRIVYARHTAAAAIMPLWALAAKREHRLIVRFAAHGAGTRICVSGELPTKLYEQLEAGLPPDPAPLTSPA